MFKFDFKINEEDLEDKTDEDITEQCKNNDDKTISHLKTIKNNTSVSCSNTLITCKEIKLVEYLHSNNTTNEQRSVTAFTTHGVEIWTVEAIEMEATQDSHTDLISGVYEGGLKVWECTQDLADYLTEKDSDGKFIVENWRGKSVLDLGCGAGVLGLLSMIHGANVTFQDYNNEVLETTTIPNIMANKDIYEDIDLSGIQLFSGDWDDFTKKLETESSSLKYDIILTSETIYNEKYYGKLINVFNKLLKQDGIVYLAAKTYYFGVGGGLRTFETALNETGLFMSEVVWKCNTGLLREILKITKNPNIKS